MHWRVASDCFEFRHFGDESVLFDPRSGLTHFLNAAAVEALDLLSQQPLSIEELTCALMERCDVSSAGDFATDVEQLVHQLVRLDLIERSP